MSLLSSNMMCDCLCRGRVSNKGLIAALLFAWILSGTFLMLTWYEMPGQQNELRFVFQNFNQPPTLRKEFQKPGNQLGKHAVVKRNVSITTLTTKPEEKHYTPCLILIWTIERNEIEKGWPKENLSLNGNCRITYKHNAVYSAHVIVLHQKIMHSILPWKHSRKRSQRFVWWSDENPWDLKHFGQRDPRKFGNFFNLTMTYRTDSDVFFPIWRKESLFKEVANHPQSVDEIIRPKTLLAIWTADDCKPSRGNQIRMKYAVALVKAGLSFTKTGICFNKEDKVDLKPYMFYLVLVDGYHCKDYLHEKIWQALVKGLVPVIFGPYRDDVLNQLPHHSFIHAEDFRTTRALVDHMHAVALNKTLYKEYFIWRESRDIELDDAVIHSHHPNLKLRSQEATGWSRLCEKFREMEAKNQTQVIRSLEDFVFNTESKHCMGPQDKLVT
ncbi:4-galactosyl-N-acetylglucosaminide 3-alpha-L-fucosyltransferase FUT5-like [Ciona intestinalis]